MSRKPSKPETRIEDYLDVMTGGNAALPQPILRIEFYYAFLAGMTVKLPQPILDDEKLLAKICGMEVEAPTYIPGISPRLYAYMAKKGGQDVEIPQPVTREEMYWFDYVGGEPIPSEQEYTGAVPITFVADGTPLLDYIISGNTVQSGTPTPDSPIMPQGTGERTGNLFDKDNATIYSLYPGTGNTIKTSSNARSIAIPCEGGEIYTVSKKPGERFLVCFTTEPIASQVAYTDAVTDNRAASITVAAPSNAKFLFVYFYNSMADVDTAETMVNSIMINTGSTPLPYEPYGYKIPISSANTTTNIYLGEVESIRQIKKLVFDGTENWQLHPTYSNLFRLDINDYLFSETNTSLCTHYKSVVNTGAAYVSNGETCFYYGGSTARLIYIKDETYTTAADFKAYLAAQYANGTPVTIWYILATSITGIVNEPLMRIVDYADTLSMEQAGAQIPTANGSTTLDVETTVKPSEVYIKYRGEAVTTLSSLPAEVSSPEETPEEVNPEETEEEENER